MIIGKIEKVNDNTKSKKSSKKEQIEKLYKANTANWQAVLDEREARKSCISSKHIPEPVGTPEKWEKLYIDELKSKVEIKGDDLTCQELVDFQAAFTDRAVHGDEVRHSMRADIGKERSVGPVSLNDDSRDLLHDHDVVVRVFTLRQRTIDRKTSVRAVDATVVIDGKFFFPTSLLCKLKPGCDVSGSPVSDHTAVGTKVPYIKECKDFAKSLHKEHEKLIAATWDISISGESGSITLIDAATAPKLSSGVGKDQKYWSLLRRTIGRYFKKQHKNRLVVRAVTVDDTDRKTVKYEYDAIGPWNKLIMAKEKFAITYSEPVDTVPKSILVLPLLANFLPLVWIKNASIELPECDADFYDSIPEIKEGYKNMFPEISFEGIVSAGKLVKNTKAESGNSACMFSGGVDAFATLIRNVETRPALFMIIGADVRIGRDEAIGYMKDVLHQNARDFDLPEMWCDTTVRKVFRRMLLDHIVYKYGDSWWHGFQHGIGMLSHIAPLAWLHGIDTVFIASSFTAADKYTSASDPTIDNHVRFCGTRVIHDGYELSRIMKLGVISEYRKEKGYPDFIRVCIRPEWGKGKNCCRSEKCIRTILDLYSLRRDPADFGFYVYGSMKDISDSLAEIGAKLGGKMRSKYIPVRDSLRSSYSREEVDPDLLWLYDLDFENMSDDDIKAYFKRHIQEDMV